ncbi:MAG: hypothetical protein NTU83_14865, partial [Candidatus Hydrogenedentes bacterium]|nr:hypothetical protein [Candidatus Hydrogenedentota bacterium]
MSALRALHTHLRLAAWVILLLVMIVGGFERYYVTGWNTPILAVAAVGLAILFTAGLLEPSRREPAERGIAAWMETIAHYLPLILFLTLGPTIPAMGRLSKFDYTARGVSNIPVQTGSGPLSVSLLDLHASHTRLDGLSIEVIGTGHLLSETDRKALPPSAAHRDVRAILYRYMITCCAADATTVSAVLNDVDAAAIREDQWYRVRGRAQYVAEGFNVPFIAVDMIEPIEAPHNPYL